MKFTNQLITFFISLNLIISQSLFANLTPNLNLISKSNLGSISKSSLNKTDILTNKQGYNLSTSADQNNRQLHKEEIAWIKEKAGEYATLNNISKEQAKKLLLLAGYSEVDFLWNNSFDINSKDMANAKEYLAQFKNQSYTDKKGNTQNYFVAKDGDYYKPYVYLYDTDWGNTKEILQGAYHQSPYKSLKDKTTQTLKYISDNKLDTAKFIVNSTINSIKDCANNPGLCAVNTLQSIGDGVLDGSFEFIYSHIPSLKDDLNSYYGFNASDYLKALSIAKASNSFLEAGGIAGVASIGIKAGQALTKTAINKSEEIINKNIDEAINLSNRVAGKGEVSQAIENVSKTGVKGADSAANVATYPKLKLDLIQQNWDNIARADPRLAKAVQGSHNQNINYSIGSGTNEEANRLGRIWVGDGAKPTSDGKGLISADGLRVYRPSVIKPNTPAQYNPTGKQANFEKYENKTISQKVNGKWETKIQRVKIGNGHLNITD